VQVDLDNSPARRVGAGCRNREIFLFLLRKTRLKEMPVYRMCIARSELIFAIHRTFELLCTLSVPQEIQRISIVVRTCNRREKLHATEIIGINMRQLFTLLFK
jgi:hypothetical protein